MSGKVHNYYEKLVFDSLDRMLAEKGHDVDEALFEDMACIALNNLPARYVRFDIDTTFYLTPKELQQIEANVSQAVNNAIDFILSKRN